jgi:hypothetical protein
LADRSRLSAQVSSLRAQLASEATLDAGDGNDGALVWPPLYPTGHFHSPVPDMADIRAHAGRIFAEADRFPGIDLRTDAQYDLMRRIMPLTVGHPFGPQPREGLRYFSGNDYFGWADGLLLLGMLRLLRPSRVIEVGSGFSSALILDVADRYLDADFQCTFIEPHPHRLRRLLRPSDYDDASVIEQRLQDVDPAVFDDLAPGDVLFIDSSHVSKIDSDVNLLFLDVIPQLPAGVHIHVHDIVWPFEYPQSWVFEGRAWNEAYLLRSLLIGNERLQISIWGSQLRQHHPAKMQSLWPEWAADGGTSLWLQTTDPGPAPR